LPSFNHHPRIASVVFIDIIAVGGNGSIITIAVAVAVAVAIAISTIAAIAVIVDVHRCCPIVVVKLPSSNRRPQITTIVLIDIVAVNGSGGIIAITITASIIISAIAVVAVIVGVHHRCPIDVVLSPLSYRRPRMPPSSSSTLSPLAAVAETSPSPSPSPLTLPSPSPSLSPP
jgi:hypothetical protein